MKSIKDRNQLESSGHKNYSHRNTSSICEPVKHKPYTVGWCSAEDYTAQVFMNSNDIIKGPIFKILNKSKGIFCKSTLG